MNTADLKAAGRASDGENYFLKRPCDEPNIPLVEYICHELANACHLSTPKHAIIYNGTEYYFGSRAEGGVGTLHSHLAPLVNLLSFEKVNQQLSRWYAFDLVIANEDRHFGNFLAKNTMLGASILGIDFGRSMLFRGIPINGACFDPTWNTVLQNRDWRQRIARINLDVTSAYKTINAVGNLPEDWMSHALEHCPKDWTKGGIRSYLCKWWRSDRHRRIKNVRRSIASGRYL